MADLNQPDLGIGARVKHPAFGIGIVVGMDASTIDVFFQSEGDREISRSFKGFEVLEAAPEIAQRVDLTDIQHMVTKAIKDASAEKSPIEMGQKWIGGKLVIEPGNAELQSKEVPIYTFFHKIVMVRDRLRVLEQQINSNEKLEDAEKVNLQQYITRAYGSLTTFNILFADKADHF